MGFIMASIVKHPLVIMVAITQACIDFTFTVATMLSLTIIKVSHPITFHVVLQQIHLTFKINHLLFGLEKVCGIHTEFHFLMVNLPF